MGETPNTYTTERKVVFTWDARSASVWGVLTGYAYKAFIQEQGQGNWVVNASGDACSERGFEPATFPTLAAALIYADDQLIDADARQTAERESELQRKVREDQRLADEWTAAVAALAERDAKR